MIAKTSPNRLEIKFSIPILQTIVLSTCYAFLPNVVNLLFVMATLPYFYRKKWTVFLSFLLPQLFHLFIDSRGTYLLLIYFIGYVSFASFVRLCRGNLRISMNLFQLISCVIFSIQPNQQKTVLVIMLLVQAILMGEEDEEMILFTLFLGAMGLLLYYLMPDNSEVFLILSLILICSLANVKLSCMMFFVYFLFFGISPLLFVGILLLNQLKNHRVVFVGVFLCFIAMIEMTWMEYLFSIICGGMMIALDEINTKDNKQLIRLENEHRNNLQQQLQNFSSIFENLSVYYENQSAIQSIF